MLVPEYKLAFISYLLYPPVPPLLPANLPLGLSYGNANQIRKGVQPAVVGAAAGMTIPRQSSSYLECGRCRSSKAVIVAIRE